MFKEKPVLTGRVLFQLHDKDGNLKQEVDIKNLIVTTGKQWIAQRLGPTAAAPAQMGYIAVGTGTAAPALTDTALGAEISGSRTALTTAGGTVSNNVNSLSVQLGPGVGTGNITEAGIFISASAGTMVARTSFSGINKAAGDTLTVSWSITNS